MGEIQCGKCGEMVDEAKAFCPGCGNAFADEKERTTLSNFDLSDSTVRLSDSMYNQMLSDMGLSISKQPNRDENNSQVVIPAAPVPVAKAVEQKTSPAPVSSRSSKIIWIAAIVFGAIAIVVLAAVAILIFYNR